MPAYARWVSDLPVSRRQLLGWAGGAAAGAALAGCSLDGPAPARERVSCVARGALSRHLRLAGLPLVYEVSGQGHAFWFDEDFADRLADWLADLREAGLRAQRLWTYGAWTDGRAEQNGDGGCRSWHHAGRAFDLARIELAGGRFVSCRYDQWRGQTGTALRRAQREYWALAGSLHRRFAYVVTYPYNADHHNHIHIDNARSGRGPSAFDPGSPTQVQAIQAISSHVWDRPVEVTGRWDAATRRATAEVLSTLGSGGELTGESDGRSNWDRYLAASAARVTD